MCGTLQSFSFRSLFLANNYMYIIHVSRSYLEDMLAFLNTVAILKRLLPNMHVIIQAYNHDEMKYNGTFDNGLSILWKPSQCRQKAACPKSFPKVYNT